jgi:hypothetical protein
VNGPNTKILVVELGIAPKVWCFFFTFYHNIWIIYNSWTI